MIISSPHRVAAVESFWGGVGRALHIDVRDTECSGGCDIGWQRCSISWREHEYPLVSLPITCNRSPHVAAEGLGGGPGILATLYQVLLFTWSILTVVVQLSTHAWAYFWMMRSSDTLIIIMEMNSMHQHMHGAYLCWLFCRCAHRCVAMNENQQCSR